MDGRNQQLWKGDPKPGVPASPGSLLEMHILRL
jgi:hypothetical protein